MIRGLLLALLIWGGSSLSILAARRNGENFSSPQVLTIGECDLPCWAGVEIGVHRDSRFWITLDQVVAAGGMMFSGTPSTNERGIIQQLRLTITPSDQLTLGDVLLLYGTPEYARAVQSAALTPTGRIVTTDLYLYWLDGYIEVRAGQPDGRAQLSPSMWVREIVMRKPSPESIVPLGSSRWRGFGNIHKYDFNF